MARMGAHGVLGEVGTPSVRSLPVRTSIGEMTSVRSNPASMRPSRRGAELTRCLVGFVLASGCGPRVDDDLASTAASEPATTADSAAVASDGATVEPETGTGPGNWELASILFIVDNTGTVLGGQERLAEAATGMVEDLTASGVDFRLAVTTVDSGNNVWCVSSTPENGAFVLSSCRSRPEDFTLGDVLPRDPTCELNCSIENLVIEPTPLSGEPLVARRPWIEVHDGSANLENAAIGDAIPCMMLQGLRGCGFKQPLESMLQAIEHTQDPDAPEYGFFAPGTLPVVVILTNAVDCSFNRDYEEAIFSPEGPRTFWTFRDTPSRAICWNAGVQCDAAWNCEPAYVDPFGDPVPPGEAVLLPVQRYQQILSELEATTGEEALLYGIVGAGADGSVVYGPAEDPDVAAEYGVELTCGEPLVDGAVPPVRIRELVHSQGGTLHSVCADSYAPALQSLASAIIDRMAGG